MSSSRALAILPGPMTTLPSPRARVLVVDDDPKTVSMVRLYLEHDGHEVVVAYNGRQALEEAEAQLPDLVVLDLMLPQVDGLEVCRRLRERSAIPILMLTARTTEEDTTRGLDLGADDYVHKPFRPRELAARVRALLRRGPAREEAAELRSGDVALDLAARVARRGVTRLVLTAREFALLETLVRASGRPVSREDLVTRAFGEGFEGFDRTVDAHVMNLRRKLEEDPSQPRRVVTVFGVGYRFDPVEGGGA